MGGDGVTIDVWFHHKAGEVSDDNKGIEPAGSEATADEQPGESESDWPHLSDLDLEVCLEPTSLLVLTPGFSGTNELS
jgi:hypothetical protein